MLQKRNYRILALGCAVCAFLVPGLYGCSGDRPPSQQEVKSFKGGPPPPEAMRVIQAAQSAKHPTGPPAH